MSDINRNRLFPVLAALGAVGSLAPLPASAAGTAPTAMAAATVADMDANVQAGQLEVPVSKSQILTVDRAFGQIMVGDPKIADIMAITSRSIYVLGRKSGTTSLTIYDRAKRVIAVVDVAVGPDVVGLRQQMAKLLPGERISAHISNKSIVLTGVASSAVAISRAVELAKTYVDNANANEAGSEAAPGDAKAGMAAMANGIAALMTPSGDGNNRGTVVNMVTVGQSQQVMLEVRFSEVRRDNGKNIGLGAFLNSRSGRFDGVFGNGAQLVPNPDTGAGIMQRSAVTDTFGVFRQLFTIGGLSIEGTLDAMEEKGLIKTLAQPTLIALSGETASFLAGGEFPIPVVQNSNGIGTSAQVTVQFKPFGVSLAFTPTVLADGVISLSVEPEVSSLDSSASVQINGLSIPGLRTRRASTVLELHDGEAFAIAGLLSQDFGSTVRQLPILGSLPIIGTLFRSSGFQRGETELVIVVIPRLVQPTKPENISLPTDRVRNPSESDLFLMGRTDKAVGANPLDPGKSPSTSMPAPSAAPAAPATDSNKGKQGYEY